MTLFTAHVFNTLIHEHTLLLACKRCRGSCERGRCEVTDLANLCVLGHREHGTAWFQPLGNALRKALSAFSALRKALGSHGDFVPGY